MRDRRWFLLTAAGCVPAMLTGRLAAATEVGQPAPALTIPELDGRDFDLAALRGKVVIVNFWATWGEPCRQEIPALGAFYQQHHAQGLEMMGISADRPRDKRDVESMAKTMPYPVALLRSASANGFGPPRSLPTTFVIDKAGTVRAELQPDQTPVTEQSLNATVLPLL